MMTKTRPYRTFDVTLRDHTVTVRATTRADAIETALREYYDLKLHHFYGEPNAPSLREALKREARASVNRDPKPDGYDHVRIYYALDVKVGARVCVLASHFIRPKKGTVVYPGISSRYVVVQLDGSDRCLAFPPEQCAIIGRAA